MNNVIIEPSVALAQVRVRLSPSLGRWIEIYNIMGPGSALAGQTRAEAYHGRVAGSPRHAPERLPVPVATGQSSWDPT